MKTNVRVSNQPQVITVATNFAAKISSAVDVDMTNASTGALLQYDDTTKTWYARTIIEESGLIIDCGNY